MIKEFVDKWEENKATIQALFEQKHPEDYKEIVYNVISVLNDGYGTPDPSKIHEIDDGSYQGTLLYVIAEQGYQPNTYWCVAVDYGSCSGCDTLESIRSYSREKPNSGQVKDYMVLALHIVQGLKKINEY